MNDKAAPLVKVTLIKPHKHAGKPHQPGDIIEVTAPERDWLQSQQIVAPTASPAKKDTP